MVTMRSLPEMKLDSTFNSVVLPAPVPPETMTFNRLLTAALIRSMAATALPPVANLRRFIAEGADLVAFSGGKAIRGPQASGILCGRRDLIESVALQHQDMDVDPRTWSWRARYLDSGRLPGPPHHGFGRAMKVGKEEIVGLVVALRRFVARDHQAEATAWLAQLGRLAGALEDVPGLRCRILLPPETPRPYPYLTIGLETAKPARAAWDLIRRLQDEGWQKLTTHNAHQLWQAP